MAKIFEVDFTKFDPGSSTDAVDNISGVPITDNLNIIKSTPVPGFNFRPGITFLDDSTDRAYNLRTAHPAANWHGTFPYRSFVIWFYTIGVNPGSRSAIWAELIDNSTTVYNGLRGSNNDFNDIDLWLDGNRDIVFNDIFNNAGWYNIVITIDKTITETKGYLNGSLHTTVNRVTPNTPGSFMVNRIGDNGSTYSSNVSYGYIATYDHILNQTEIENIYNTFLNDSPVGETAAATLTGVVVDESFNTVPGVEVYLLDHAGSRLVSSAVTDSEGKYSVIIPTFGDYTVMASHPPNPGTVAESFTVPSSGVIVFHNS